MCKVGNKNQHEKRRGFPRLLKFTARSGLQRCWSVDVHTTTIFVEADIAIHKGENGVIPAKADIATRGPFGAALADDDVASNDGLAAEFLDAETLALAVATVFDGTLSFFMGHKGREVKGLGVDGGDLHEGQRLTMTTGFVEALALAELEGGGLGGLVLL